MKLNHDAVGKMTDKELLKRIDVFSDTEELVDVMTDRFDYYSSEMAVHTLGLWNLVNQLGNRLRELSPEEKP